MVELSALPYLLLGWVSVIGGFILWGTVIWIWKQDTSNPHTRPFTWLITAFGFWASGGGLMVLSQTVSGKIITLTTVSMAAILVPAFWIHFAVLYTNIWNDRWKKIVLATYIISGIFAILILTNPLHHFYWDNIYLAELSWVVLARNRLPLFWVSYMYAYGVVLFSTALVAYRSLETSKLHRKKLYIYVIGPFIPISFELYSSLGFTPHYLDVSPLGFGIWGILMVYIFYSHTMYNVSPIGRKFAFESIQNPILIFDRNGQLTDWNSMSEAFLIDNPGGLQWGESLHPITRNSLTDQMGKTLEDIGDSIDNAADGKQNPIHYDELSIPHSQEGEERVYNIQLTPVIVNNGTLRGYVIVFYDVTPLARHRREVEKRNERLDRFASVVSHDLRNPISVANGYLDMIDDNEDKVEPVKNSLSRMEEIINELLVLAREDNAISKTDDVDISETASNAWELVNTFDGNISIDVDMNVKADENYIMSIFENLFRNVYDHCSMDTNVYVGELKTQNGFFIADDGQGIPQEAEGSLFKEGFTTDEDGTGLGLSIVDKIVKGHDWEIHLDDETEEFGAKFDIIIKE